MSEIANEGGSSGCGKCSSLGEWAELQRVWRARSILFESDLCGSLKGGEYAC